MAPFGWTVLPRDMEGVPTEVGIRLLKVIWVLAGLSLLLLGLRLYSKIYRRRPLWWDDYLLAAAWITLALSVSLQTGAVSVGLGKHYDTMTGDQAKQVAIFSIPAGFCAILATSWSKTSFAMSLLRISTGRVRTVVWGIIISTNIIFAVLGLTQWIQCWPMSHLFDYREPGSCWNPIALQTFNTFAAAFSGTMDIVLALVPWRIVWTQSINKREKIGVLLAMSMGIFAGITAFLKIRTVYAIGNSSTTTVELFIFGTAEPATAIMAASIPFLRALVQRDSHMATPRFIEFSQRAKSEDRSGSQSQVSGLDRVYTRSQESQNWQDEEVQGAGGEWPQTRWAR